MDPIRDTINEAGCDIFCFQETKRQNFEAQFIRNFSPQGFDSFEFLPSNGASGGLITGWKSSIFSGHLIFQNNYAITVKLTAQHNNESWYLTNIYGPCTHNGKRDFIRWLKHFIIPNDENWLLVGDFNIIRKPEDGNKPGGDVNEMLLFNEAISALGLVELPLYGRRFTWTNKQPSPLLERLGWFFTSSSWTNTYPETSASSLVKQTSDHWPCNITISTVIPKGQVFRIENFWMQHPTFIQTVQQGWAEIRSQADKAKTITAKFKNLRKVLKAWQKKFAGIKKILENAKIILSLLETIEEFRDLTILE